MSAVLFFCLYFSTRVPSSTDNCQRGWWSHNISAQSVISVGRSGRFSFLIEVECCCRCWLNWMLWALPGRVNRECVYYVCECCVYEYVVCILCCETSECVVLCARAWARLTGRARLTHKMFTIEIVSCHVLECFFCVASQQIRLINQHHRHGNDNWTKKCMHYTKSTITIHWIKQQ